MKDSTFYSVKRPEVILDNIYIKLLRKFKNYNANGNKLICSYMAAGQNYQNELLVIGREPLFWRENFFVSELNTVGEEIIFKTKVSDPAISGIDSLCPLSYIIDLWGNTDRRSYYSTLYNTCHDPFWGCVKDLVIKLGICYDETLWSSFIALTYLYKLAYSKNRFLLEKPRLMQLDYCRKILNLEIEILRPKRVLFLSGLSYVKEFLNLPDALAMKEPIHNLGNFNFGTHIAKTIITVNPKKFHKNDLVELLLKEFSIDC